MRFGPTWCPPVVGRGRGALSVNRMKGGLGYPLEVPHLPHSITLQPSHLPCESGRVPSRPTEGSFVSGLRCSRSGARLDPEREWNLSPSGAPILVDYDLPQVRSAVDRDEVSVRTPGMWRFRELMPLPFEFAPVSLGEGDTPLLEAPELAAALGIGRLWIKDEAQNPTGSFKARGMSAAVSMAHRFGARHLVAPSAGNAGGALAAYAARVGLRATVYVPSDTPEVNRLEVPLMGGTLVEVDGLIDACGRRAAAEREGLGAFDVSTLKEPYRIEGKKTMGLELAQQLGWKLPDVIVYPTGGGTGLVGMDRAFDQLRELGWLEADHQPRFVSVQASGCAPIVNAYHAGADAATKVEGAHTIASGLRVPAAIGDRLILSALRRSGGTAVAVDDDELLAATFELASRTGINACPEAGACLAAIRRLVAEDRSLADASVVLFNTGAGSKYIEVMRELARRRSS